MTRSQPDFHGRIFSGKGYALTRHDHEFWPWGPTRGAASAQHVFKAVEVSCWHAQRSGDCYWQWLRVEWHLPSRRCCRRKLGMWTALGNIKLSERLQCVQVSPTFLGVTHTRGTENSRPGCCSHIYCRQRCPRECPRVISNFVSMIVNEGVTRG